MRPGQLAMRVANQYRTRDVLSYLGLRYYFTSRCACRDRWAHDVSTHLVMTRSGNPYFRSLHFKDIRHDGTIDHREMFLPGPNESFAEAALLDQCSRQVAFESLPCVFSYRLASDDRATTIYAPYFVGIKERHQKIADACGRQGQGVVLYTDIKKFYPSIPAEIALKAWDRACDASTLPDGYRRLGHKLLHDHYNVAREIKHGNGLLTGPMFSHLIANLVLRNMDEAMNAKFPDRYFRYVDDIVLVGGRQEVMEGRETVKAYLGELGLELHSRDQGKDFEVEIPEWMGGSADFDGAESHGWMVFVRELKQFLVSRPDKRNSLADIFLDSELRVPLPDYLVAIQEASYIERINDLRRRFRWFSGRLRQISSARLLTLATALRSHYSEQLNRVLDLGPEIRGYQRKRVIPKLRYFGGRLLFLADRESLASYGLALRAYSELAMLGEVMLAVASRDISTLVSFGSNAVQSAAQSLRLTAEPIQCQRSSWGDASQQGLAVLRANGLQVAGPSDDDLNRFALWNGNYRELTESANLFIREVASLHGASSYARHSEILGTAFARDEELAFDAINQLQDSNYA